MDMSGTIRANSDQLNAVDLMGGGVVVTIKSVVIKPGDKQSMWIEVEENFNTFKPCLTMRRVIMDIWGKETNDHIGRQLVLYCEPTVLWSGQQEGGVRISHASHITETKRIRVRESKYKTGVWEVHPLVIEPAQNAPTVEAVTGLMNDCDDIGRMKAYGELIAEHKGSFTADEIALLKKHYVDRCESIKNQN